MQQLLKEADRADVYYYSIRQAKRKAIGWAAGMPDPDNYDTDVRNAWIDAKIAEYQLLDAQNKEEGYTNPNLPAAIRYLEWTKTTNLSKSKIYNALIYADYKVTPKRKSRKKKND